MMMRVTFGCVLLCSLVAAIVEIESDDGAQETKRRHDDDESRLLVAAMVSKVSDE